MVILREDVLEKQKFFFDKHPFPGLNLDHITTLQQYNYTLEKNSLYRAIKNLFKPRDRVLDAGCGTGELTTYLAIDSGAEIIGIDYSEETITWANGVKRRFFDRPELSFCHSDIFKLTANDFGMFEYVLAMGLFPSIPNERVGMKRLTEVIKPGGNAIFGFFDPIGRANTRAKRKLLQSVSLEFSNQKAICQNVLLRHIDDPNEKIWHINQLTEEFLNYHSPSQAASMMEECGLEITDCYPQMKLFGDIFREPLRMGGKHSIPFPQLLGQLRWLWTGTDGYFVLVGRKKGLGES